MSKTTYTATLPNGKTVTRKSTRDYAYAVAVLSGPTREDANWGLYSFNARFDLAAKQANQLRAKIGQVYVSGKIDFEVKIVEVTS